MPLQTSGTISINDLRNEFGLGGTRGLNSFYADSSDPWIGTIPTSGTIAMNDFYGSSVRTARMGRPGFGDAASSTGYVNRRIGWSRQDGSQFYLYEYGSTNAAFGSITRSTSLSTTAQLGGIWITQYWYGFGSQTNRPVFSISHRSSSDSGWTRVRLKGPSFPSGGQVEFSLRRVDRYTFARHSYGTTEQRNYYAWRYVWWQSSGMSTLLQSIANLFVYCRIYNRSLYVKFE